MSAPTKTPIPFPILLLDGGLGTTLETNHHQTFTEETPLWSSHLLISNPSTLVEAQKCFVEARVDLLLSATYQASFEGFKKTKRVEKCNVEGKRADDEREENIDEINKEGGEGDEKSGYAKEDAAKYMRNAISLARVAISSASPSQYNLNRGSASIVLSLGPLGATLVPSQEYTGRYPATHQTTPQLSLWHLNRLKIFKDYPETWSNIQYIAFETVPKIEEILAVREAVASLYSPYQEDQYRKFWISCVFPNFVTDVSKEEWNKLPDGSTIKEAVVAMLGPGPESSKPLPLPWGIGINCTRTTHLSALIFEFEAAVESIMDLSNKPETPLNPLKPPFLVIYPDNASGLRYNTTTKVWEPESIRIGDSISVSWDETVFEVVKEVRGRRKWSGVAVGGCCKTAQENIVLLRKRIDEAGWGLTK